MNNHKEMKMNGMYLSKEKKWKKKKIELSNLV